MLVPCKVAQLVLQLAHVACCEWLGVIVGPYRDTPLPLTTGHMGELWHKYVALT